jgi:hypothetical protein
MWSITKDCFELWEQNAARGEVLRLRRAPNGTAGEDALRRSEVATRLRVEVCSRTVG